MRSGIGMTTTLITDKVREMGSAFPRAVEDVARELFAPVVNEPVVRDYLTDSARRTEAEAVDPCVERLADYEIEPPAHGKGVGRYAPKTLTPPIGSLIGGKRIAALDDETRLRLRRAIVDATAVGYAGLIGVESDGEGFKPSTDVDPKKIWCLWVVRLNSEVLREVGIDKDFDSQMRGLAAERFVAELKAVGLFPKVRKRMRFNLVGQWYGQAGMLLRLIQSTQSEWDDSSDFWQITNTWPFEP